MLTLCMVPTNGSKKSDNRKEMERCLAAMAKGDRKALEDFYSLARVPVYSFSLSILKNRFDAEDVLHDCVLQVWQAAPRYRSQGTPMTYVLTVAKNLCRMKLRERAKTEQDPPENWEENTAAGEGLSYEEKWLLKECMQSLPDEQRQIVVLHAVAGLRHREIAALLNLPLSTVLSKYNRTIQKIRKMLEGEKEQCHVDTSSKR